MSERTPWFPGSVEPEIEGFYDCEIELDGYVFHMGLVRWERGRWLIRAGVTPDGSRCVDFGVPPNWMGETFRWRGLTRPAGES